MEERHISEQRRRDAENRELLERQRAALGAAFAQSNAGQLEAVREYIAWGEIEHKNCRESIMTRTRWTKPDGKPGLRIVPGLDGGGADLPADAIVESNVKSVKAALQAITRFLAVAYAMREQLQQDSRYRLPENYRDEMERLKAAIPETSKTLEVIRGPKAAK